jgi:hypothetical protein
MTAQHDPRRRRDAGQAIVMVLVFITMFGAIIAALLNYAYAGLKSSEHLRVQRAGTYSAAGATDTAIQYLRSSPTLGAFGASCPTVILTTNSVAATVTCTNTSGMRATDRVLSLVATVGGTARLNASIIIRDSKVVSGSPPTVQVLTWAYVP